MAVSDANISTTISRYNRDKRFRSLATAYIQSLRLSRLLEDELTRRTPTIFGDADMPRTVTELQRRAALPDDCPGGRITQAVTDLILPALLEAENKKPVGPAKNKVKLPTDRKVNVGFAGVSPAIPIVLCGEPRDVRAALAVAARAQDSARFLYFSHEPKTAEDVWYKHKGNQTHVLAPSWSSLLHSRKAMRLAMDKIEAEQGGEAFELLLVDDVGVRPSGYSSIASYVARAAHSCGQLLYWAKHRGTAMLLGLHKRTETYSSSDHQALSGICEVWHVSRDDDDIIASDSSGMEHVIGGLEDE